MNSIILRTAASFLLPLLLLASIVILLRGHNEPGGGSGSVWGTSSVSAPGGRAAPILRVEIRAASVPAVSGT